MNLTSIRQSIENMEYGWNKPASYLAFVPVISIAVEVIQLAKIIPLKIYPKDDNPNSNYFKQAKTYWNIGKWHLAGSMTQSVVSIIAAGVFANPAIALFYIPAVVHFVGTFVVLSTHAVPSIDLPIESGGGVSS